MRVLTVTPPGSSHLAAMVPLCWALRAAGHEVLVAALPDSVSAARGAGLNVVEIGTEQPTDEGPGEDMFPAEAAGQRDTDLGRFIWHLLATDMAQHATDNVEEWLRVARAWGPDLLLVDPMALAGRILQGVLGVPAVAHRWGVDPTAGPFEEKVQELLAPLCGRLGLPGLPAPTLVIDPCPPSLQAEDAPTGQLIRYVPHNGTASLPEWALTRPAGRRICVCMGGTVMALAGPRSFLRTVDALAGLDDVDAVAALTPADRHTVGELPAGIRVVESLPLNLFLGTCDLLIHHGGSGTGLTGTSFGLPQLVLPQLADEFDYGRRLAEAGAGISIPDAAGQSDVDGIRAAITKLLADPGYAEAAQRLRAEIDAAPAPDTAVGVLEDLVGSPGR
jgi:UDP:flavonoid glycosyltransferase YjiC (YdhE family)